MKCNEFGNSTDPDLFGIGNEFGGIPNNFITNFLGWLIFMLIFVLSRKSCIKVIVGTLGKNWARISGAFFNPEPPSEPISGQDAEAGVGEREVYHSDNISNLSDPECSHVTDRLIRNRHEELARAANRLIGEVVQSRRRPLLGPSPGWKRLLPLSHLRHY